MPPPGEGTFYLQEGVSTAPSATNFTWPRESSLWNIARRRYFAASVVPLQAEQLRLELDHLRDPRLHTFAVFHRR